MIYKIKLNDKNILKFKIIGPYKTCLYGLENIPTVI